MSDDESTVIDDLRTAEEGQMYEVGLWESVYHAGHQYESVSLKVEDKRIEDVSDTFGTRAVEELELRGTSTNPSSVGEIEHWIITVEKYSSGVWSVPEVRGIYYDENDMEYLSTDCAEVTSIGEVTNNATYGG